MIPISISSQRSILAMRSKYLTQVAMLSSLDSSERSSMWELRMKAVSGASFYNDLKTTHEKRGSPLILK